MQVNQDFMTERNFGLVADKKLLTGKSSNNLNHVLSEFISQNIKSLVMYN